MTHIELDGQAYPFPNPQTGLAFVFLLGLFEGPSTMHFIIKQIVDEQARSGSGWFQPRRQGNLQDHTMVRRVAAKLEHIAAECLGDGLGWHPDSQNAAQAFHPLLKGVDWTVVTENLFQLYGIALEPAEDARRGGIPSLLSAVRHTA